MTELNHEGFQAALNEISSFPEEDIKPLYDKNGNRICLYCGKIFSPQYDIHVVCNNCAKKDTRRFWKSWGENKK